jgi:glycosyltransferase involved in cell wall biosynthesis
MRIVHLVDSFSPLSETFIYDYITELQCNGVDNHVVTFCRDNVEERPFENVHLITLPSRWHPERVFGKIKRHLHIVETSESFRELYRHRLCPLIEEINPDVIHAHFGPMGVLVEPISAKLGIPSVVSFHGYDAFALPKEKTWADKYKTLFSQMGMVTVVSNVMRDQIINLGAPSKKVRIVHVGKRVEDYKYRRIEKPLNRWISIGRFCEKKGFDDCIKAFAIAANGTDAVLEIIGEGDLLDAYKDYVTQNNLSKRIKFLDALPHSVAKSVMAQADAFILCSKESKNGDKEGIPTVLMEAQFMGLPCISTKHSGIPEVIPKENQWLLAEEGDVDGITESINKLMNCSEEHLEAISQRGRIKVEAEFNLTEEVKKLKDIYGAI